jgi:hypothetical protein
MAEATLYFCASFLRFVDSRVLRGLGSSSCMVYVWPSPLS